MFYKAGKGYPISFKVVFEFQKEIKVQRTPKTYMRLNYYSSCCYFRGPCFGSQNLETNLQPSLEFAVREIQSFLLVLYVPCIYVMHIHIGVHTTSMHIEFKICTLKKLLVEYYVKKISRKI